MKAPPAVKVPRSPAAAGAVRAAVTGARAWKAAAAVKGPGPVAMPAAAALGLLMVALPALTAPAAAQGVTAAGLLAVGISLTGWWRPAGTLAAVAATVLCAVGRPGIVLLAADGLIIAGYLLFVDAPPRLRPPMLRRWLAAQAPGLCAAVPVSGAVLAAIALPAAPSAWIALAGAAAAAAAYLIALPRQPRPPT